MKYYHVSRQTSVDAREARGARGREALGHNMIALSTRTRVVRVKVIGQLARCVSTTSATRRRRNRVHWIISAMLYESTVAVSNE
jgi:hypothetical protein